MSYEKAIAVMQEVRKAVKGKDEIIEKVMMAVLAKGHILMEDIPGVGNAVYDRCTSVRCNRIFNV